MMHRFFIGDSPQLNSSLRLYLTRELELIGLMNDPQFLRLFFFPLFLIQFADCSYGDKWSFVRVS